MRPASLSEAVSCLLTSSRMCCFSFLFVLLCPLIGVGLIGVKFRLSSPLSRILIADESILLISDLIKFSSSGLTRPGLPLTGDAPRDSCTGAMSLLDAVEAIRVGKYLRAYC